MLIKKQILHVFIIIMAIAIIISCSEDKIINQPNQTGNYKIAYINESSTDGAVYTINPDGTEMTALTDSDKDDYNPIWASDRNIYFTSNFNSNGEIYRMNEVGTAKINLTDSPEYESLKDVAPDSKHMIFSASYDANETELYIMNLDSLTIRKLTPNSSEGIGDARFTPDGQSIVYCRTAMFYSKIYVTDLNGTTHTQISPVSNLEYSPRISPDGSKIVFVSQSSSYEHSDIWICNIDGSNRVNVTDNDYECRHPQWIANGSKVVYSEFQNSIANIYICNSDGSDRIRLTDSTAFDSSPSVSPDGSKIAYLTSRDGNVEIYIMDSDGSNHIRLTDNDHYDNYPVWSPAL